MRNKLSERNGPHGSLRVCRQLGEQRFGVWPAMAGQHPRRDEPLDHRFRRFVAHQLPRRFDQSGLLHLAQRCGGFQSHVRTHRHVLGQLEESRERLGRLQCRQAANRQDMHRRSVTSPANRFIQTSRMGACSQRARAGSINSAMSRSCGSNCSQSSAAACRASSTTSARATVKRVSRSWSGCCSNFMSGSIAASRPVSPFG